MLAYNEITPGTRIVLDGIPYEALSSHVFRKQQRKPVNQTKLRNLTNGKVIERSFHQNESIEEADIETIDMLFLYAHRGECWFSPPDNPKERMSVPEAVVGPAGKFLKEKTSVTMLRFNNAVIGVKLPIKIDLRVIEAPPAVRGNTAQGATKQVVLETGAVVNTPLFISEGDIVRINTETGEYSERVEKG